MSDMGPPLVKSGVRPISADLSRRMPWSFQ